MEKSLEEIIAEGGTVCEVCGERKLISDGCTCSEVIFKNTRYERIKYGEGEYDFDDCCHDCGAKEGHYHHPGCDMEICPICGEQAIGCECEYEFVD